MQPGDKFDFIEVAREAIRRYVLDNGESFKLKNRIRSGSLLSVRILGVGLVSEHPNRVRKWFLSPSSSCILVVIAASILLIMCKCRVETMNFCRPRSFSRFQIPGAWKAPTGSQLPLMGT